MLKAVSRHTLQKQISLAGTISDEVPLPEGVIMRSEEDMVIWRQMSSARTALDWRDADLIMLAKFVRLEADIRKLQKQLDITGHLIEDEKGMPIINPLVVLVDKLQRQQITVSRGLGIMVQPQNPSVIMDAGRAQQKTRKIMKDNSELIPGL